MRAVILAAGKGSRLGNLTDDTPKSMLKLNDNHTLLSYNIMQLSEAGIDSIILVSGYQSQKIEEYAQELAKIYGISIEKYPVSTLMLNLCEQREQFREIGFIFVAFCFANIQKQK